MRVYTGDSGHERVISSARERNAETAVHGHGKRSIVGQKGPERVERCFLRSLACTRHHALFSSYCLRPGNQSNMYTLSAYLLCHLAGESSSFCHTAHADTGRHQSDERDQHRDEIKSTRGTPITTSTHTQALSLRTRFLPIEQKQSQAALTLESESGLDLRSRCTKWVRV